MRSDESFGPSYHCKFFHRRISIAYPRYPQVVALASTEWTWIADLRSKQSN